MGRFRLWWRGLTKGRKLLAVVVAAFALLGMTTVAGVAKLLQAFEAANAPGVLYSGMSADDSARVRAELERMGESYESTDDRIMVGADRRDVLRMTLFERNVAPQGGLLGSVLIVNKLTPANVDSEFARQRALQGELESGIKTMEGVADARVILAIPADSTAAAPTAAVLLTLQPGVTIAPSPAANIARLVVHSVPRLTEDKLVIIDNHMLKLYPLDNARPASNLAKERS